MAGPSIIEKPDAREYWAGYLADARPSHFPRFDGDTHSPKRPLSIKVPLDHLPDGQKLSVEDGARWPVLLRAAWGLLLRCYAGSEDVCFGYLETGSHASFDDIKKTAETFVDMAIVRMSVEGTTSLDRLLHEARQDYVRGFPYQHSLLVKTAIALELPDRRLFNTAILIRNELDATASAKAVASARSLSMANSERCNLRLHAKLLNRGMSIFLEWWSSDMSMQQAMNVAATFGQILRLVVLCPNTQISELDYLSEQNRQQICKWNGPPSEGVRRCIHDIIHDRVVSEPNAEAVCAWDGTFTYRELDELSTRLAHHLADLGVGPEVFVPLCFDKSVWTIVSMLGVLKAGGAFVPLDPSHPIGRLQALAQTLRAKILLCSRRHTDPLATVAAKVLPIDADAIDQLPAKLDDGASRAAPNNAAYVIFTSGSTGEPKGAVLEHAAYCSSAVAHAPALDMRSTTRALQFAAHTFDASLLELLTPLMVGGCVCIPSEEARLNNIATVITDMRVNWATLTPSFIEFMEPSTVPSLETLFLVGEAMSHGHIRRWSSKVKLGNGYGPTECAVSAVVNPRMTHDTEPTNIGRPIGGRCWVADPSNHDRLVPIGCIGELLVEGPTLARGYLNDSQKTSESFIKGPVWARAETTGGPRRMYKTGDLVRWNPDGTLNFVGRKDTQVKLHGQRVELGEIESHLNANQEIKHGLVILPKSGCCKHRLVSILSLSDVLGQEPLKLVDGPVKQMATARVTTIRERLSSLLPAHMVPSTWIVVQAVPLLPSGKLDRKMVARWVEEMSEEMYGRITDAVETEENSVAPSTELEGQLQTIWSHVLNLPLGQVGLNRSWLSLGGDSITAMQVMGHCRRKGIGVTVQDILRSKSIAQLALRANQVEHLSYHDDEVTEKAFDLSPIQQLFFRLPNQGQGHFNQSFFLRIARKIREEDLRRAIHTVIETHSMLRARFDRTGPNGEWQQRITHESTASYRFRVHTIDRHKQATPAIAQSQARLDPTNGPLFVVDLFNVREDDQLVFMVGHHLVIDLVSWRIILQDVEDLLLSGSVASSMAAKPLSFQTWCRLQAEHSQHLTPSNVLPGDNAPPADFAYWGMTDRPNVYGGVTCNGFQLDASLTSSILTDCHHTLRTETIDILLAALIYSFGQIFTDRAVPPIYNEGHGREPWNTALDLSRTVGWFTTMYPVSVPASTARDLIETVRRVKDFRRRVPDNGRPYFASRLLTQDGRERFGHHWPMEMSFNYLGKYQQLEREGALLRPVEEMAGEAHGAGGRADVGRDTPRFALFEISAVIAQGSIRFSFTYDRHMRHQDSIRRWISTCQRTLGIAAEALSHMEPEVTLSDFPLLSLTQDRLTKLVTEILPQIGVTSFDAVESAYPCSPIQQGLLLSHIKDSANYAVEVIYEVTKAGVDAERVDGQLLGQAWQAVVNRHSALRTVFIESVSNQDRLFDQVVLKQVTADVVLRMECDDALSAIEKQQPITYEHGRRPPHRFTISQATSGKIFCKLEVSHTIIDGASMSILFRDLALAYEGRLPKYLGPLYGDYIAFLQDQRSRSDEALSYWKSYITGIKPCHFPVLDDGDPSARELCSMRIEFDRFLELQRFCDENGVTVSNAIHTAWALTLRCYTGSDDTCFGYLSSGRDALDDRLQDAVGPFINMLACRVNMLATSQLEQILHRVQEDYIDSLPYRHTSLAEIQHALHLSGTALFNTAVSYRKLSQVSDAERARVSFSKCKARDPTEYNVSINIEASEEGAVIDLDYWTDVMSAGQAANVASTFVHSLCNIIQYSKQTVQELDHFSERNRQQVWSWNSQMPETMHECVHRIVEQQAHLRPGAPAICSWDANFTYDELDKLTSRLAHYLVAIGVMPEALVPVCFSKSAWTMVAILGIWKAGGAYVPLDPGHPKTAFEARLRDIQAGVVLAAPQHAELLEDVVPHVILIEPSFLNQLPDVDSIACTTVQPENACYVIYTSGSTGQPKGVVIEHRSLSTSARAHGSVLGIGPSSRVLQFSSYTFDNSLEEMFTTLMRGGCVCVPSDHDRMNGLANFINRLEVNFAGLTPTVANTLQPSDIPTIQTLVLGGEPLTKQLTEVWGKVVSLHNIYGPAECSINSAWNGDVGLRGEPSNIGRAIGCLSWVVDPSNHDRLVPVGCAGELLLEGPILARGYLNDPQKTAQAFLEDPAWAIGNESAHGQKRRMYKTGDLVRYNSDGTMTYLGRKDTQVKLNGQRIELGEIEHHIEFNLPAEAQSAVELISTGGHKALAAFLYLPSDEGLPSSIYKDLVLPMSEAVRSVSKRLEIALGGALPAYMVPSVYLPVVRMPLTSSGKLDRRTLRTVAQSLSEEQAATYRLAEKSGREPSTEMEKTLQRLWKTVLGLTADSVGVDDSFFRLGGDSVAAIRLVNVARSEGIHLNVANIFQRPKLSEMSTDATAAGHNDLESTQAEPEPFALLKHHNSSLAQLIEEVATQCQVGTESVEDMYPCTSLQQGLIAISTKQPGAYVAQTIYRLPITVDVNRFREAWERVVEEEAILRTRIVYTKASGFVQIVVRGSITWHAASSLQDIAEEDRHLPTHDGRALTRYTIVGEGSTDPQFVWTIHHALYDGWSIPLILKRVEAAYHDIEPSTMPARTSYSRFIKYLSSIDSAASDNYWLSRLSETTALQFPQLPQPAHQVSATGLLRHAVHISREAGTDITIPSMVRAAWALVIAAHSGSDDVVFGETLTGRDVPVPDIADMIGPTLATVPMRIQLNSQSAVGSFLNDVQEQAANVIAYQHAGIQRIKQLSSDTSVACNFQNLLVISYDTEEPRYSLLDQQNGGADDTNFHTYPLILSCKVSNSKVDLSAYYDQGVIPTWQVQRILWQFESILGRLNPSAADGTTVGEMEILSLRDRDTLWDWNSKQLKLVDKCIHQLIQQQAASQPEATAAVCSWDVNFTYRELDELSTRLAHHLVGLGVGPEVLVPLCFEKSAWTIVGMLGVLKAGGAFVPLDPSYPVARLRDRAEDVGATVVLCSSRYHELCKSIAALAIPVDSPTIDRIPVHHDPLPSTRGNNVAYVLFTSGTTGKPKGVLVEHAAFCTSAAAHGPAMLMRSTSRVLQFASYTFDASLFEILTTLILGGCVCVPNEEARLNDIAGAINEMRVTLALLTPSFVQHIQPFTVPGLQTLVLGGEAMTSSHISAWANYVNLVNGYGPSECAVIAAGNSHIIEGMDPARIGHAVGGYCWIVDPNNHNRLAPIGSVGELLVEGPILARGYLNDEQRTAESFVRNPKWATSSDDSEGQRERRMYKTGDLVKYNRNGSMTFIGRKDTQVKVRGQRLELDEVEHHLASDPTVQHALAAVPASGYCAKQLVAVLSIQNLDTPTFPSAELKLVDREAAIRPISRLRERLSERLPAYMVPSKWVVVQNIPLSPSGKLDRGLVKRWVNNMSHEVLCQISNFAVEDDSAATQATDMERRLQLILGDVLNMPPEQIAVSQSFVRLGGDSLSGMQVMAQCRAEDIGLTVQDILQSKSISHLASLAKLPDRSMYDPENVDQPFDLSPIQRLYFDCVGDNWKHFNQSVLLRLARKIQLSDLTHAIEAVANSHSMLRARFSKGEAGVWQQRITRDVTTSYRFRVHNANSGDVEQILSTVRDSQKDLDIQKGPIFAVDLFHINGDSQLMSFAAHHLSVDVVSWSVLLHDLEVLLNSGTLKAESSLSFQTWCQLQVEQAHKEVAERVLSYDDVPVADLTYWGMENQRNVHGDVITNAFEVDAKTTLHLLGQCHEALRTEVVDILLAAVIQSFGCVFSDRAAPAVYNEGHGREPWDAKLNLSRTVGWFTTLCPVYLPNTPGSEDDVVDAVRFVKDLRRRLPEKGRPYFAYRLLTEDGRKRFARHWPMEVVFNYLGQSQQLNRKGVILQPVAELFGRPVHGASDVGPGVPRFALIEISAGVTRGRINFSFAYNRYMKHQARIRAWIANCQRSLQDVAERLMQKSSEPTLSDFPLLPLTYDGLAQMSQRLAQIGVSSLSEVENTYPCSPMQQGILLSQIKDPVFYAYQCVFRVRSKEKETPVDTDRLIEAWGQVVRRHATLRTVFIESVCQTGLVDQVVIKMPSTRTAFIECDDTLFGSTLYEQSPINYRDVQPPHRFTLFKTSTGQVFCRLEMSHAISDGASLPVLLRDLARAYEGQLPKEIGPLYSDYIAHIQSRSREVDLEYWKTYLADIQPCYFPILNDGIKEKEKSQSLILELTQVRELHNLCAENNVTLSNVLQLVWALVLRVYTESDEVCFGYLVSGRNAPVRGIEDAVGTFINMLICRMNLSDSLPLNQALDQIQTDFVRSMPHDICSLAEVQHALHLSGTALFNTAFSYQNRSGSKNATQSAILFDILDAQDPSEYNMSVNVEASESRIIIHFGFRVEYVSKAQAANVIGTFEHVLNQVIRPDHNVQTVGQLDFFSQLSRQQVEGWNGELPKMVDKCVHQMIEQQVLSRPESAAAVCAWDADLTYRELDKLATSLAHHLVGLGVGPEVYVPLCFEKSAWTVVSMIAVMKAGGAFVPLDPLHPPSRIKHIAENVRAKLILCSSKHSKLAAMAAEMTFVVNYNTISQLPDYLAMQVYSKATSGNTAYIIHTSGTTGTPKGTVIEHAAFCTSAIAHGRAFLMDSTSRFLQFASYTFDASILEILTTLIVGGCICIPNDQQRLSDIAAVINNMAVNLAVLTPSVASTIEPATVPDLKVLVLGGEAMTTEHIAKWAEKVRLINAYGPSECSVVATVSIKQTEAKNQESRDPANIGRAVGGRCWVVNSRNHNQLVPVGSTGELVIEGYIVARGYLNDEQRTVNTFISNPAWIDYMGGKSGHSCRMFKTGDLVRYNSDGTLRFIGRKDTQIKLHGQRIELGEIERHLRLNLPGQTQSAVELVSPGHAGAKTLAAFFSLPTDLPGDTQSGNGNSTLFISDASTGDVAFLLPMSDAVRSVAKSLEKSLGNALPTYMNPSLYVPVMKMPYTTSGKLDRRRLRNAVETLSEEDLALYRLADSTSSERVPSTEMEKKLQRLWEATLNLKHDSVRMDDNFFKRGGDSVAAIKLVTTARSEGISLTVPDVFQRPTLSEMATASIALKGDNQSQEQATIDRPILEPFTLLGGGEAVSQLIDELASACRVGKEAVQDVYPCSSLQEGLITLSMKQPGAYVARNVFRLPTGIDLCRFQAAWQKIVAEEMILRTRFVRPETSVLLEVILHAEPILWHTAENLQALLKEDQQLPAYAGGPLTQYTLVDERGSSGARYFVWSIHHALYDGWSMSILLQRVQDAYFNRLSAEPKTMPYNRFIEYLLTRNRFASDTFWRLRLSGASPLQFPQLPLTESDQNRDTRTVTHTGYFSRDATGTDIRLPTIIRAAWAVLVAAYTGTDDVVFGEILAGRDVPVEGITNIIGPTIATVPTRVRINRESNIANFLKEMQGQAVEAISYQHAGLQHIKQLSSDASVACDFQNLLAINYDSEQTTNELWNQQNLGDQANFFTYPLVVECFVNDTRIKIDATHDANVISGWQVQRLLYQFESVLRQLIKDEEKPLNKVEVFSLQDKEVVEKWNSHEPVMVEECAHDVFERQASLQPDAPAVCAWDCDFTYNELRLHATRLAQHLVRLGVGPEVLVPICFDKSAWAIVAILGTLNAGGAFVPLNASDPISRHQEIIHDVNAKLLLCSPQYTKRYAELVNKVVPVDEKMINHLPRPTKFSTGTTSQNAAYVIFTSGTTGKPKGIVVEHAAFCTSAPAHARGLMMKPRSRVLQFASYNFDASVMEILTTLTYGEGCVCVPSEDARVNDVAGAINSMNVNWAFLTPSVASVIEPSSVPGLEVLACGGDKLSAETIARWGEQVTLVECYGPTECAIIATANPKVAEKKNPSNIGHCLDGGRTWIVDSHNHNRLVPLGSVGELLIEGPTLAREYLNNEQKTAEAFIENPAWASAEEVERPTRRRMYKTGDLVRYDSDGTLIFIGRKDHQIKLNGQRLELGEIETCLEANTHVQHALVVLPKSGICKQRLVAVVSLREFVPATPALATDISEILVDGPRSARARLLLAEVRNRLSDQLPSYMVPAMWVIVEVIPMLVSGKLARNQVTKWVESIDKKTHRLIAGISSDEDSTPPATPTARVLQQAWSCVLNIPLEQVKLNESFLSLGGDSITAMQVMARCRKEDINVTMHQILKSKSITQLALCAGSGKRSSSPEEKTDLMFDLSPIQRLYFESISKQNRGSRCNQSFLLRIMKQTEAQNLKRAIEAIINKHSMLRARFGQNEAGVWQQHITRELSSSYRFRTHHVSIVDEIVPAVVDSQSSINIENGPLFAADLFDLRGGGQVVFLVAHHLVVDLMSWRIILHDLEELLGSRTLTEDKPLSFQAWCTLQTEQIRRLIAGGTSSVLPFKVASADLGYWGMAGRANTYGDIKHDVFMLDEAATALAIGDCHKALRTEPVDLFLMAILHSFTHVFVDREAPTVFIESHGREPWNSTIDLSRTVGWFTAMYPVHVPAMRGDDDAVETIRWIKDTRRRVPYNGRPYFASRFLTAKGEEQFSDHMPMEILFNYLGQYQQMEHDKSLFQQLEIKDEEAAKAMSDMASDTSRLALFEVSAVVLRGRLQFSFTYNKRMQHQDGIRHWIAQCQQTLQHTTSHLVRAQAEPTLSDFPLLPLSYGTLRRMVKETFPRAGISQFDEVEDIYPCSPMQEGLLLSQLKDSGLYTFASVFEAKPVQAGMRVDAQQLMRAWEKVVCRHAALRTIFVESVCRDGSYDQIVLRRVKGGALLVKCEDEDLEVLSSKPPSCKSRLPHQLTVYETSAGRVFCKMEVNHAIIDGGSVPVMMHDLVMAYEKRLTEGIGPLYSDYIAYIQSQPPGRSIEHWQTYLDGIEPCHFPTLNEENVKGKRIESIELKFGRFSELQQVCEKLNVTLANVLQAAWALVLRAYTGSDDVCYGYLTSGRDIPVDGIQEAIGAFINMLICRIKFSQTSSLETVFQTIQNDYLRSQPYQHCSLAQIHHALGLSGRPLFNTALSIQNHSSPSDSERSIISFEHRAGQDPSEYKITLNVETSRGNEGAVLRYWTNTLSSAQAANVVGALAQVLDDIVSRPHRTVAELNLSSPSDQQQIWSQSHMLSCESILRKVVNESMHEILEEWLESGNLGKMNLQGRLNGHLEKQMTGQENGTNDLTAAEDSNKEPGAHVEKKLLSLWSAVLNTEEESIGADDNFFSLGGDSIIAMKMVGIARAEGIALSVADIFRHPQFSELAATARVIHETDDDETSSDTKIDEAAASSENDQPIAFNNASNRQVVASEVNKPKVAISEAINHQNSTYQPFSLLQVRNVYTFLQEHICPHVRVFRGGIADVLPVTDFQALAITGSLLASRWMLNYFFLDGKGSVDLRQLKQSAFRVVQNYEILRTVFVPYENRFFQVVLRKLQPEFHVSETEDDMDEFTAALYQKDRENGPHLGESYVQFTVAKRKNSDQHRIILRISHAQYDGVCLPTIFDALRSGYQGQPIPFIPPFSRFVHDSIGKITHGHYEHWRALLQGSSMTDIVHREAPSYSRSSGETTVLKKTVPLPSLASQNITPATVIKAAWSLVLAQLTGRSDIVFGHVINGRNASVPEIDRIIGPCLNTVPVRVKFQSSWKALDLLRDIQQQQVTNMPFESLGFREIIQYCTEWPKWTHFSTVVQHQNVTQHTKFHIGETAYIFGAMGSQEDLADLSVLSTPKVDDTVEIALIFSPESGISPAFAEMALNMLCATVVSMSQNPSTILPSPSELSGMQGQTLKTASKVAEMQGLLTSRLEGLGQKQVLVLLDYLNRAWRQVLGDENGKIRPLHLGSSFFELGGDFIDVAQVAHLLQKEGFKVAIEDLINHPLLVDQLALLTMRGVSQMSGNMLTDAISGPEHQQLEHALNRKGSFNDLWKAGLKLGMGLAKKKLRQRLEGAEVQV